MTRHQMPSASEIYAQRRAAREARANANSLDAALGIAQPAAQSAQRAGLDHQAIYARRRQEAQQRGRAIR